MFVTLVLAACLQQGAPQKPPETTAPAPAAPAPAEADVTPEDRLEALQKSYADAMAAFSKKYEAAKDDAERNKLFESDYPKPADYAPKFLALADSAKGTKAALQAYVWVLRNSRNDAAAAKRIYTALLADFVDAPEVKDAVTTLGRYGLSTDGEAFLREVLARSKTAVVKGYATLSLAGLTLSKVRIAEALKGADAQERRKSYESSYGADVVAALVQADPAKLQAEAEQLFETVAKEYGSIEHSYRGTLAKAAQAELFELRNLQIGKTAPEISGADLDGGAFKLSDYRGKVVVLDFWGFW